MKLKNILNKIISTTKCDTKLRILSVQVDCCVQRDRTLSKTVAEETYATQTNTNFHKLPPKKLPW